MSKSRPNALDISVMLVVFISGFGFWMAKAGHAGVDKVIEGKCPVAIDVYISGLKTEDLNLFKKGDTASFTVRNVPIEPPMTILRVQHWPKQAAFLSLDGKKAIALPDPSSNFMHDFLVEITDVAEKTKDGYVIKGNKIKVGNTVELESFKYRVQGVISDIKPLTSKDVP